MAVMAASMNAMPRGALRVIGRGARPERQTFVDSFDAILLGARSGVC